MKELLLLLAAVTLVAVPAAAGEDASALGVPTQQVAPTAEQAPAGAADEVPLFADEAPLQTLLTGDCTDTALDAAIIIPPPWPCPFGAPRCKKHDDCDDYCGDPRFGYCLSDGCCGCTG